MRNLRALFQKDKRLGSAKGTRQYDLPLDNNSGTDFLIFLIALMTFLAIMALAGSFALGSIANSWSSGLENKATIEIPAEKSDGSLRSVEKIEDFTAQVAKAIRQNENVETLTVLQKDDIIALVSPWLGDDIILDEIPLPGLISLELRKTTPEIIDGLVMDLALINDNIRLDTHESWLLDLLRITGALQFAGVLITLIIGVATITAIAGAIRSRMAIHRKDIELLHLMGASDEYITVQFQRHALILAIKGSMMGGLGSTLVLGGLHISSRSLETALLPAGTYSLFHIIVLLATPALACLIAKFSARTTVLRALSVMP